MQDSLIDLASDAIERLKLDPLALPANSNNSPSDQILTALDIIAAIIEGEL